MNPNTKAAVLRKHLFMAAGDNFPVEFYISAKPSIIMDAMEEYGQIKTHERDEFAFGFAMFVWNRYRQIGDNEVSTMRKLLELYKDSNPHKTI